MGASGKGKSLKKKGLSRKARKQMRKQKHLTVKQREKMLERMQTRGSK